MGEIHALAAREAKGKLEPFSYDPGPLGDEDVEIEVQYCGLCHSDLSILNDEFHMTHYPLVPGHEAIGRIVAAGEDVKSVQMGQTVGLGWFAYSCLHCSQCLAGDHNMCNTVQATILGRHGAFGTRVRCHWVWATPIPYEVDITKAGPLLCGGVTVFNPFVQFNVRPTDRVGVIGIGGLGHLALQFANKWGCHVTAFTTSASKADEAKRMGAHAVIDTRSTDELKKAAGSFHLILSTITGALDLQAYLAALAPKGRFHTVGFLPEIKTDVYSLLARQNSISSSPSGPPSALASMLAFAGRHGVEPIVEEYPMTKVNEAIERLAAGKAHYRIVLKNDLQ